MDTREPDATGRIERAATRPIYLVIWAVALVGLAAGIMIVAVLLTVVVRGRGPASDLPIVSGVQGATSALLAALALVVISASLVVQRTNLRRDETRELDRVLADLRDQIRTNPEYGQCWVPEFLRSTYQNIFSSTRLA